MRKYRFGHERTWLYAKHTMSDKRGGMLSQYLVEALGQSWTGMTTLLAYEDGKLIAHANVANELNAFATEHFFGQHYMKETPDYRAYRACERIANSDYDSGSGKYRNDTWQRAEEALKRILLPRLGLTNGDDK